MNGHKHILSDVIGGFIILGTGAMLGYDMYNSNNPDYHFHLEWWHTVLGVGLGAVFIFFEPADIRNLITSILNKKLK